MSESIQESSFHLVCNWKTLKLIDIVYFKLYSSYACIIEWNTCRGSKHQYGEMSAYNFMPSGLLIWLPCAEKLWQRFIAPYLPAPWLEVVWWQSFLYWQLHGWVVARGCVAGWFPRALWWLCPGQRCAGARLRATEPRVSSSGIGGTRELQKWEVRNWFRW